MTQRVGMQPVPASRWQTQRPPAIDANEGAACRCAITGKKRAGALSPGKPSRCGFTGKKQCGQRCGHCDPRPQKRMTGSTRTVRGDVHRQQDDNLTRSIPCRRRRMSADDGAGTMRHPHRGKATQYVQRVVRCPFRQRPGRKAARRRGLPYLRDRKAERLGG